jgi:hypothetical protein
MARPSQSAYDLLTHRYRMSRLHEVTNATMLSVTIMQALGERSQLSVGPLALEKVRGL